MEVLTMSTVKTLKVFTENKTKKKPHRKTFKLFDLLEF